MTLGIAVLLFVLAVGGVIVSALCLKTKKTLRTICLVVFIAAAILLAGYIGLTFLFLDAVSHQPPTP